MAIHGNWWHDKIIEGTKASTTLTRMAKREAGALIALLPYSALTCLTVP